MRRIILGLILGHFSGIVYADTCASSVVELHKGSIIQNNKFARSRDLRDYQHTFKFRFGSDNAMLERHLREGGSMTYVDMGAGQGLALRQAKQQNPELNAIGIAYKAPESAEAAIEESPIQYLSGKFVEEMLDDGDLNHLVGQVDFITDLYGPLSYSNNFMKVFESYLTLLKVDGVMTFNLMIQRKITRNHHVIMNDFDGEGLFPFLIWLKSIKGLEVEIGRPSAPSLMGGEVFQSFKITKRSSNISFRNEIEILEYTEDAPAIRKFRIKK